MTGGYRIDVQPGGWITATTAYNTVKYNATTGSPTTFSSGSTYAATNYGTRIPLTGTSIENIVVSHYADTIYLNSSANVVSGYTPGVAGGADVIYGSDQAGTLDLAKFMRSGVGQSQVGNDLVLSLGTTGSVTVKGFYAVAEASRIVILYKDTTVDIPIAAASADKSEGTGGTTSFTFTVTRSGDLTGASSVSWGVTGSVANQADAADFSGGVLPSGSVSFAVGETAKTITVTVAADSSVELDEGFTVTLSAPTGGTLGAAISAAGTIRNDDLPALSIGDARVVEGDSGTTTATAVVTLSSAALAPVTVAYTTFDRTATASGDDYVATSGILFFTAGETSKTITLSVRGDIAVESDETFGVRLSTPSGATIAKAEGVVTIANDDISSGIRSRISIAATDAIKNEGHMGRTAFSFIVTRTGSLDGDVTLPWSVVGSGARPVDRFDFIGGGLPTGAVRFITGRRTATVTVNVLSDRVAEFDEQFTVTLGAPSGGLDALLEGAISAVGTILNDDAGIPRPAASVPTQGRAAMPGSSSGSAAAQTIVAQAFAAMANVPETGPTTTKRAGPCFSNGVS